jgi:hypothetical protein
MTKSAQKEVIDVNTKIAQTTARLGKALNLVRKAGLNNPKFDSLKTVKYIRFSGWLQLCIAAGHDLANGIS